MSGLPLVLVGETSCANYDGATIAGVRRIEETKTGTSSVSIDLPVAVSFRSLFASYAAAKLATKLT